MFQLKLRQVNYGATVCLKETVGDFNFHVTAIILQVTVIITWHMRQATTSTSSTNHVSSTDVPNASSFLFSSFKKNYGDVRYCQGGWFSKPTFPRVADITYKVD